MSFDFGQLLSNLGDNLKGNVNSLQAMPMNQKLLATGMLLQGQTPNWAALMHQYGGGSQQAFPGMTQDPLSAAAGQVQRQSGLPGSNPMRRGFGFGTY